MIERAPVIQVGERLAQWKQLRDQGWDLTVLLADDKRTVIAFGHLPLWQPRPLR